MKARSLNSFIHNSQKMEVTQVSINRSMDAQNVVDTHNRIVFRLNNEGTSDAVAHAHNPSTLGSRGRQIT